MKRLLFFEVLLGLLLAGGSANARTIESTLDCKSGKEETPGALRLGFPFQPEETSVTDAEKISITRKNRDDFSYDVIQVEVLSEQLDHKASESCEPDGTHITEASWKQKLRMRAKDPASGKKFSFTTVFQCHRSRTVSHRISDCPRTEDPYSDEE